MSAITLKATAAATRKWVETYHKRQTAARRTTIRSRRPWRDNPSYGKLLALVPNIRCELPVSPNPLPHHDIFAGDFFWSRPLCLKAERAYFARRRRSLSFDVDSCKLRVAGLLRHPFPQGAYSRSAFHHG
jgi:hypothetical protein